MQRRVADAGRACLQRTGRYDRAMSTPFRVVARSVFAAFSAALCTVLFVILGAGSAAAETPASWADPEPTTAFRELLLYGGSLVGLVVGLALLSLVRHRNNHVAAAPRDGLHEHLV